MLLVIYLVFFKITSQTRQNSDIASIATVMNLFVFAELTLESHPCQYIYTGKDGSKSVCSLIQPNLGSWFERLLEMLIVYMNYALRQFDSSYCLSCKYFMLDSSILDISSDIYAKSIQDNCKNLLDNTI